ncbi:MAG: sulfatase-like hydrolase/transferase [Novosphingobium sp.]|nr:sulfatase-like hydrolase/transferase [Novosphingobium sp.]
MGEHLPLGGLLARVSADRGHVRQGEVGRDLDLAGSMAVSQHQFAVVQPRGPLRSGDPHDIERRSPGGGGLLNAPLQTARQAEAESVAVIGIAPAGVERQQRCAERVELTKKVADPVDQMRSGGAQPSAAGCFVEPPVRHVRSGCREIGRKGREIGQLRLADRPAGDHAPEHCPYLAFTAPHFPLQAPKETIAKYRGRYEEEYEALRHRRLTRQVELGLLDKATLAHGFDIALPWASLTLEQKARVSRRMEVYAAMVDRLDQNVGRVMRALKASGELGRTIVLFLSDNGADGMLLGSLPQGAAARARQEAADSSLDNIGTATSYESIGPGWAEALNAPYWRFKGSLAEGGTRVVAFLSGYGIARGVGGAFTSVIDVVPTFLELAGVPAPEGTFAGRDVQPIRGRSWVSWLMGWAEQVYPPQQAVSGELLGGRVVRRGEWKLVDIGDGRWRPFDLSRDPGETRDLAARAPRRVAAMAGPWEDYANSVGVIDTRNCGACVEDVSTRETTHRAGQ